MTDSETEEHPSNMFTFQDQNSNTMIYAKGPSINSNISGMSSRNNMLTSTTNMPWNLDRLRYAQSVYEQRSIYHRRETSPMSFHSASGFQPRNFHHQHQRDGISSHRSTYNGRSGSPMSVRTIDSNTSVITADIVSAFKTASFNKYDLRKIKDAYNKFMKHRVRQRVEKRRNLRRFLKGFRRKSGGDSGDQASNSSLSSDDNRSTRSTRTRIYQDNASCRSTRTNVNDLKRTIRESSIYRDCTKNFKQGSMRNISPVPSTSFRDNRMQESHSNALYMTQKDRFKNGFVLPSQRFNQSIASQSISENPLCSQKNNEKNMHCTKNSSNQRRRQQRNDDTDSEQEQIFSELTDLEKSSCRGDKSQGKRGLDDDDLSVSVKKKTKLSSPPITKQNTDKTSITKDGGKSKDFEFAKPKFPVRKIGNVKNLQKSLLSSPRQNLSKSNLTAQSTEKSISKSLQQLKDNSVPATSKQHPKETHNSPKPPVNSFAKPPDQPVEQLISKSLQPFDALECPLQVQKVSQNNLYHEAGQCDASEIAQNSNLSMRPSFIKRKLFTQKVDVADNKNASSDSVQADSPQSNIYSDIQKEKHKTRKLVTSQSCLNRDVLGDESNLLDLIHKIVPPDQINLTSVTNRSEVHNNKSKPANTGDKWDVSTVISTCKDGEESDTYTDEEIFQVEGSVTQQKTIIKKQKNTNIEVSPRKVDKTKNNANQIKYIKGNSNKNIFKLAQKEAEDSNKSFECRNNTNVSKQKSPTKNIKQQNVIALSKPKSSVLLKEQTVAKSNSNEGVQNKQPTQCVIVVEKLQPQHLNKSVKATEVYEKDISKCYKSVKSFWDTDIESDFDMQDTPNCKYQKGNDKKNTPFGNTSVDAMSKVNKKSNIENIAPVTNKTEIPNTKTIKNKLTISVNNGKIKLPAVSKTADIPKPVQKATKTNKNSVTVNETLKQKQNDVTLVKKTNKKTTLDSANVTLNTNKPKLLTNNNNNTLRLRSRRSPKLNKCCDEPEKSINDCCEIYSSCLRSRESQLSTSLRSNANIAVKGKSTAKNKVSSKKNISSANDVKENSKLSDISFTLTLETPVVKRLAANRRLTKLKNNGSIIDMSKTPQSDVSFTLRSGKSLNTPEPRKRVLRARNNSKYGMSREGENLQVHTPVYSRSCKRTPAIKQPQISKNTSKLDRSKLNSKSTKMK